MGQNTLKQPRKVLPVPRKPQISLLDSVVTVQIRAERNWSIAGELKWAGGTIALRNNSRTGGPGIVDPAGPVRNVQSLHLTAI